MTGAGGWGFLFGLRGALLALMHAVPVSRQGEEVRPRAGWPSLQRGECRLHGPAAEYSRVPAFVLRAGRGLAEWG